MIFEDGRKLSVWFNQASRHICKLVPQEIFWTEFTVNPPIDFYVNSYVLTNIFSQGLKSACPGIVNVESKALHFSCAVWLDWGVPVCVAGINSLQAQWSWKAEFRALGWARGYSRVGARLEFMSSSWNPRKERVHRFHPLSTLITFINTLLIFIRR